MKDNLKLCWHPKCEKRHTTYFKLKMPGIEMDGKFCKAHLLLVLTEETLPMVKLSKLKGEEGRDLP